MKIKLGSKVRDVISGFEGVATGYVIYLTGCAQYLVAPRVTSENKIESTWFDSQRLETVGDKVVVLNNTETPGADISAPIKN